MKTKDLRLLCIPEWCNTILRFKIRVQIVLIQMRVWALSYPRKKWLKEKEVLKTLNELIQWAISKSKKTVLITLWKKTKLSLNQKRKSRTTFHSLKLNPKKLRLLMFKKWTHSKPKPWRKFARILQLLNISRKNLSSPVEIQLSSIQFKLKSLNKQSKGRITRFCQQFIQRRELILVQRFLICRVSLARRTIATDHCKASPKSWIHTFKIPITIKPMANTSIPPWALTIEFLLTLISLNNQKQNPKTKTNKHCWTWWEIIVLHSNNKWVSIWNNRDEMKCKIIYYNLKI